MRGLSPARYAVSWGLALLVTGAVFVLCMWVGPGIERGRVVEFGFPATGLTELRLSRVLAAAIVGFGLGAAGVALQALLRNVLADPYVLGISSGASVGVMLYMLGLRMLPALAAAMLVAGPVPFAVVGAAVTCVLVFMLARGRSGGQIDPLTLLLVGVVVNAVAGALLMFLSNLAPAGVKSNFMSYVMGTVSSETDNKMLYLTLGATLVGWLPLNWVARSLNVSTLSDVEAASLGVSLGVLRTVAFFCAALMTAASIALAGPIGFIGLICPHICRSLLGPDHRQLVVTAPFCGAAFLMLADTFCRSTPLYFNGELPVGVITAMAGGPFFLILLSRRAGKGVADVG